MHQVNIHEAKTNLSKLIQEVLDGTQVVIAKNKNPIVKLVKIEKQPLQRRLGLGSEQIQISADFGEFEDLS